MNNDNITTQEMGQYDALPVPPIDEAQTAGAQPVSTELSQNSLSTEDSLEENSSTETFEDDEGQLKEDTDEEQDAGEDAKESEADKRSDDEKRAAHEAAEEKRKAEWEARQKAKKDAETETLRQITAMTDEALIAASMKKVEEGTERLTHRNMKLCVMEWIQTKCLDDLIFAHMAMHPKKSMLNCFHYINRKAKGYITQEMKDNDIPQSGIYGSDVPDELCYQWAEQYFQDPGAEEDREKEEKFAAKPYIGTIGKKPSGKKESQFQAYQAQNPYRKMGDLLTLYRDYIRMCRQLDYDLSNGFVLFPRHLKKSHDKLSTLIDRAKAAAHDQKIRSQFPALKGLFQFTHGGLVVIPPRNANEIADEGHRLHHCVGSYVASVAADESTILFIRDAKKPRTPLCTIELKDNRVRQTRCHMNQGVCFFCSLFLTNRFPCPTRLPMPATLKVTVHQS